jgi:hypothetical protein
MEAMNLVATTFATQPVCNAARAAHALRSSQFFIVHDKWHEQSNILDVSICCLSASYSLPFITIKIKAMRVFK